MVNELQTSLTLREGPALPLGILPEVPQPPVEPGIRAWSAPASFGLTVLTYLGVSFAVTLPIAAAVFYFWPGTAEWDSGKDVTLALEAGVSLLMIVGALAAPLQVGFLWLLTRKRERSPGDYLGWKGFEKRQLGYWCVWTVLYYMVADAVSLFFPDEKTSNFMQMIYEFGGGPIVLVIAVVLLGPWVEELMFRGFLFRGFRHERLSAVGAIFVTALFWALIHGQYGATGVLSILGFGVLLGLAREHTGSTKLTFVLHALFNAMALAETWICWGKSSPSL